MKRISHVLYSGLGGHGSVFFTLAEADIHHEFELQAIFSGIEPVREDYVARCQQLGISWKFQAKKPGLDAGVYWNLAKKLNSFNPSTIFLHGPSFIISALLYKLRKPKTRIIVRDTQAHHLKSGMDWFWLGCCALFAGKIVVLTKDAGELICRKFKWLPVRRKIIMIPNGINTEKYKPVLKRSSDRIVIGMQSRLQRIKDHPTLLKSFRLLMGELPQFDLKLVIAGDGETMTDLMKLKSQLALDDHVEFTGMLNESDLLRLMHSMDIYVHATFGETMSNSIMQALACGLPVIASDVWGVNNMIVNGQNGLLYPSGDVEVLANKMEELIIDREKRKQLSFAARKFAEDHYSFASMFKKYESLYNN